MGFAAIKIKKIVRVKSRGLQFWRRSLSDVAGEFPVDDVIKNCRKIGNLDAKQNRKSFSLFVPPVPEEVQSVKNGQQSVYKTPRKGKKQGQADWYQVIKRHGLIISQALPQGNTM